MNRLETMAAWFFSCLGAVLIAIGILVVPANAFADPAPTASPGAAAGPGDVTETAARSSAHMTRIAPQHAVAKRVALTRIAISVYGAGCHGGLRWRRMRPGCGRNAVRISPLVPVAPVVEALVPKGRSAKKPMRRMHLPGCGGRTTPLYLQT